MGPCHESLFTRTGFIWKVLLFPKRLLFVYYCWITVRSYKVLKTGCRLHWKHINSNGCSRLQVVSNTEFNGFKISIAILLQNGSGWLQFTDYGQFILLVSDAVWWYAESTKLLGMFSQPSLINALNLTEICSEFWSVSALTVIYVNLLKLKSFDNCLVVFIFILFINFYDIKHVYVYWFK